MSLRLFDCVVIAVGVTLAAVVAASHRSSPLAAAGLFVVVLVSTWLSVVDFREHRLPNRIVGPLAVAVTGGLALAAWSAGDLRRGLYAVVAGAALAGFLLLLSIVGDLGMGDVKFGYPIGAVLGWFGWNAVLLAVLVTTVGGALVGVALLVSGKGATYRLSYGPYMALGLAAGLLYAA